MTIQTDIEQALIDRVKSITPFTPALPINFENIDFSPPTDNGRYLELKHFQNQPVNYAWRTGTFYTGMFRIAVIDPLQRGTLEVLEICDAIIDHFADAVKLTSGDAVVLINGQPSVQPMLFDIDRQVAIFPVTINYHCNG